MKSFLNRMTLKTFLIYFLCLMIPVMGLAAYWQYERTQDQRAAYEADLNEKSERFMSNIKAELSRITQAGYSMFYNQWYRHLISASEIYQDEFNVLRRLEISEWIQDKVSAFSYVHDILMVVPYLDAVVCKTDWYTLNNYRKTINRVHLNAQKGVNEFITAQSIDANIFPIVITDTESRLYKGTACILIDKKAFSDSSRRIMNDGMQSVRVDILGQTMLNIGNQEGGYEIREVSSPAFPELTVRIGFTSFESAYLSAAGGFQMLLYAFLTIVCAFVAMLLSSITLKPLNRVLSRIHMPEGYSSTRAAFRHIDEYLVSISKDNALLKSENQHLSRSIHRFSEVMRDEILSSMVMSPDFDFEDETLRSLVPWIRDEMYYLMVLSSPGEREDALEGCLSKVECEHRESFHILSSERCDLVWFSNLQGAAAAAERLAQMAGETLEEICPCVHSSIQRELQDLQECYMSLKSELTLKMQSRYDLPISMQIEFLQRVREGRFDDVKLLIETAKISYSPDSFLRITLQIAREYDYNPLEEMGLYRKCASEKRFDELWHVLTEMLSNICDAIVNTKKRGMSDLAQAVKDIVDAEYTSFDLSRKEIADRLNVDASLISKSFKAKFGTGFSEYMIDLRMKLACELLSGEEANLSQIAERVGYMNYLSFKRAFTRVKGLSPREYHELHGK